MGRWMESEEIYDDVFEAPLGRAFLAEYRVPLIVFDSQKEVIVKWIPWMPIAVSFAKS